MESLIPIINKLQDVFNTIGTDVIELPQIVVVGTQSSGKSSVLENIVGRSFLPRGTGIVTRTPLVLQLVHSPKVPGPHRCEDDGTMNVEEYGVFLHSKEIFTDFDEIRHEIERQTEKITGTNKGISDEVISLKIYSPTVVNLTLVDLPGLTKVPVGDQPEDIETQIQKLVLKYIENPNSIIMAVVTANTDMATNESLKLAKQCDPKGDRTLAVVTKLDLMDAGTDANDILCGRVIPVKLGIIAVINRSQKDIMDNKPIAEAQKDEYEFLLKKYPSLADCNGTPYLSKTLNKLLIKHIKECLPDLRQRVQLMISQTHTILESYGGEVVEKNNMLLKIIKQFSSTYKKLIKGSGSNLEAKTLVGGARICNIFHETYKAVLNNIDPLNELTRKNILTLMRNATGPRPALFIPEKALVHLAKQQIKRLEEPSLFCAQLVFEEMQQMLELCCSEMDPLLQRFPILRDKILDLVSKLLFQRMEPTNSMIENLIAIELAYMNTRHPHFEKERALSSAKNIDYDDDDDDYDDDDDKSMTQSELKDTVIVENMLKSYFQTVRTTIHDTVPKAIMHYLVNYVNENLDYELMTGLGNCADKDEIFVEAKDIANKRKQKSNVLGALHQASTIINEIRDFYM